MIGLLFRYIESPDGSRVDQSALSIVLRAVDWNNDSPENFPLENRAIESLDWSKDTLISEYTIDPSIKGTEHGKLSVLD